MGDKSTFLQLTPARFHLAPLLARPRRFHAGSMLSPTMLVLLAVLLLTVSQSVLAAMPLAHNAGDSQLFPPTTAPLARSSKPFTVSGLSAGPYFSVQLHFAYSSRISAVGVVAGGPWWCSMDEESVALSACMSEPDLIDLPTLYAAVSYAEGLNSIDDTSNLAGSRAYLYSGKEDTVVDQGVMEKLREMYEYYGVTDLSVEFDMHSEHGFPTLNNGVDCDTLQTPFILACNYSGAQHILDFIYPDSPAAKGPLTVTPAQGGDLLAISQSEYIPSGYTLDALSLSSTAYAYVPTGCQADTSQCNVHMAIHGCEQSIGDIGYDFINMTMYADWAANDGSLIILYPQITNSNANNPKSCADWWGYTSPAYATQLGPQPQTFVAMVDSLLTNTTKWKKSKLFS